MNGPIGRLRRIESDMESAVKALDDFKEQVKEISADPLVGSPSQAILDVALLVEQGEARIVEALSKFRKFASPHMGEAEAHEHQGLVVDESVRT
jgi:hypothetical protein